MRAPDGLRARSFSSHVGRGHGRTGDFRAWFRRFLVGLAEQAGATDPDTLGRQLHLLYDGAALSMRLDRDPSIAAATRGGVEVLLDDALDRAGRPVSGRR